MSGKFNETTRRLLRESEANGGLDNKALFDLMVAGHDEGIEAARVLAADVKETAETLATETKAMAVALATTLQQERRDLKAAVEKVRDDLMVYNEKLGGKLDIHIEDDRTQLARIASHLDSKAGTITRAMDLHCADTFAHRRAPRHKDDPQEYDYSGIMSRYKPEDEDREMGDLRRFWRIGKWIVMAAGLFVIDALVHLIWTA